MKRYREAFFKFLFPAESDTWLCLLRIGLGAQVVLYCLALRGAWSSLLSESSAGLISRRLPELIVSAQSAFVPQVNWLVVAGRLAGLDEQSTLALAWALLLAAGLALLVGLFCRSAAVLGWFLHLAAAKSGGLFAYGVDNFMTIGLFYLMLSPHPDRYSLDFRIWKRESDPAGRGFLRRVLQLHLCVIYFFSGLAKSLGSGWWNGSSLWRALTRPPFDLLPAGWLASFSFLLTLGGIVVCVIELGYPVLIWPRSTRNLWLCLVCAMHLGIGLAMGMYLFALVMLVLNLAAFAPDHRPGRFPLDAALRRRHNSVA
ncbi:MAG: HTTM domain-containing protein [Chthoniobacterales bacterium]